MKKILFIMLLTAGTVCTSQTKTEFSFEPDQSMCITGKGAGQDGAINPYYGSDSVAIVENKGETNFFVRIKDPKGVSTSSEISAGTTKKIVLLKGAVLFIDTDDKALANITFEKYSK